MIGQPHHKPNMLVYSHLKEGLGKLFQRRDPDAPTRRMLALFLALIVVALLLLGVSFCTLDGEHEEILQGVELVAHRGFRGVEVGNSLAAITSSFQQGAHAVEFDVSVSADGTPYVFHDRTVDFLTDGTGTFTELSDDYIDSLVYTESTDATGQGIKIPRLSELLSQLDKGAHIYPEIKNIAHRDDISTIMDIVESHGFADVSNYLSFDAHDLTAVKLQDPDAPVSLLVSASGNPSFWKLRMEVNSVAMLGKATIIFSYRNILAHPEIVAYCEDLDLDVAAYTVNDMKIIVRLANLGVIRIVSDSPRHALINQPL